MFHSTSSNDGVGQEFISNCIRCNIYEKIKWPDSGYYDGNDFYSYVDTDCPADHKITKLTDILLMNVEFSYLLSEKACAGILSRSEKRNRKMSPDLMHIINVHIKNMKGKK